MFGANPDKAIMTEQFCDSLVKHGISKGITNDRYTELEKQGRLAEITNDGRYFILRFN